MYKDTDGNGRADVRMVVLTGIAEGNQQLRVNSPTWGLDNPVWVGEVHPVPLPSRLQSGGFQLLLGLISSVAPDGVAVRGYPAYIQTHTM